MPISRIVGTSMCLSIWVDAEVSTFKVGMLADARTVQTPPSLTYDLYDNKPQTVRKLGSKIWRDFPPLLSERCLRAL